MVYLEKVENSFDRYYYMHNGNKIYFNHRQLEYYLEMYGTKDIIISNGNSI